MSETAKRRAYRESTGFFTKYLVGRGIDIGCSDDPVTPDCVQWDYSLGDSDAQFMAGVEDASFDWVYSSHCLEHMVDPSEALRNWWRILKPTGHLVVLVPDEDLYEQGMWPPHFNTDHKTTWTLHKSESWSPVCRSLAKELGELPKSRILSLAVNDTGYDYSLYQAISARMIVPRELAQHMNDNGKVLKAEWIKQDLAIEGFFPVDQSSSPYTAEISLEGIAQKRA